MDIDWFVNPAPTLRTTPVLSDVHDFHRALSGYHPTPLRELPELADELAVGRVLVKDESDRLGMPAFKALGAFWAIAQVVATRARVDGPLDLGRLRSADVNVTLVTATDGNHGRAVARMAGLLGLPARVFVPRVTAGATIEAIQGEGAEVTVVDGSYDEAVARAAEEAARHSDVALIQDTSWPGYEDVPAHIVEGYATMLLEIDEQLVTDGANGPDLVLVPVGVGSLAQAVVHHYRSRSEPSATRVVAVEPDTAACLVTSLIAGELRSVPTGTTLMAGLNCGTVSSLAWPVLRDGLDAAVTVTDEDAMTAFATLAQLGVSSGPSGAASLAGARAVLTGTNGAVRRVQLGIEADATVVLISTEAADGPASGRS